MDSAWTRAALVVCTTIAAANTQPGSPEQSCQHHFQQDGVREMCVRQDHYVYPKHVLGPLAIPCVVQAFASMPTLLLSSTRRARRLCAAAASMAALWAAVVACAAAYAWLSPSVAYAMSLHASALFLLKMDSEFNLLGSTSLDAARLSGLALLPWGAVYLGPPMPVLGAPGLSGCCGAVAHLVGWTVAETAGALLLAAVGLFSAY